MSETSKTLGGLHELLIRGLPDFVENGQLDVKGRLAPRIGVSYQAIYKWFDRDRVSARRMQELVHLSKNTSEKNRPSTMTVGGVEKPWEPLRAEDFWPFV